MKEPLSNMALLIDADNTPRNSIEEILSKAESFGQIGIKKIYGDWGSNFLKSWQSIILEHAIIPVHQFAYTKGKNATDISMVIDAMDLMLENQYDGFCLVSSDSDFTPLATRLRANQIKVFGFGKPNTPDSFQKACDEFICFESKSTTISPSPKIEQDNTSNQKVIPNRLRNLVFTAIDKNLNQDGWAKIKSISTHINVQDKSFDYKRYGFEQFLSFLQSFSKIEIKKQGDSYYCRRKISTPNNTTTTKKSIPKKIKELILEAVKQNAETNGWANIGKIGSHIKSIDSTFSSKLYGFSKLSSLLAEVPEIEVKKEGNIYFYRIKKLSNNPSHVSIPEEVKALILKGIATHTDETGWAKIGLVNLYMKKADASFNSEMYGFEKVSNLLKSIPNIEIKIGEDFSLCRQKVSIGDSVKKVPSNIKEIILKVVKENSDSKGWIKDETIADYVRNIAPNFHHELYGFTTLSKLLESISNIEVKHEGNFSICRIKDTISSSQESHQSLPIQEEVSSSKAQKKSSPKPKLNHSQVIQEIMILLKNSPHKKGWLSLSQIEYHLKGIDPNFNPQNYHFQNLEDLLGELNLQCVETPKYGKQQEKYYRKIPFLKLIEQLKRVTKRTDINIRDANGNILACALGKYARFHVYYGKYGFESFPQFLNQVMDYHKRKKEKTNATQS